MGDRASPDLKYLQHYSPVHGAHGVCIGNVINIISAVTHACIPMPCVALPLPTSMHSASPHPQYLHPLRPQDTTFVTQGLAHKSPPPRLLHHTPPWSPPIVTSPV